MKKNLFSLLVFLFLLSFYHLFSQNNEYPIKIINDIEYYIYTVEPAEGTYAISKKFGITQEEILKANPSIENGLKAGQIILIPVKKTNLEKEQSSYNHRTDSSTTSTIQFIQHKVEKKQTLFGISRLYNVSQEEIIKFNPQVEKGLREGDVLFIPKKNKEPEKIIKTDTLEKNNYPEPEKIQKGDSIYFIHLVEAGETLYSISRKYNVEVIDIIKYNPSSAEILKAGSKLKIPVLNIQPDLNQLATTEKIMQEATSEGETVSKQEKIIKIAFLLPFMLNDTKSQLSRENFIDFYAGSLLAIKKGKEKNISMEIFTYDTEKSEEKIKKILSQPELKNVDLIVGPAYSTQVSYVTEFALKNKINNLIPFSSKVYDVVYNPYVFQFNPNNRNVKLKFLYDKLYEKFKNPNIIFAEIPDINILNDNYQLMEEFKEMLANNHKKFTVFSLSSKSSSIENILKKDVDNLIFFNTDNISGVNPYLLDLLNINDKYNIILYEEYSWGNNSNIQKLKGFYVAPFKPDIDTEKLKEYEDEFNRFFNWEITSKLPRYDLLGYDLMNCFLPTLHLYGNSLNTQLNSLTYTEGLQSDFNFQRNSKKSGFINVQLYWGERNFK